MPWSSAACIWIVARWVTYVLISGLQVICLFSCVHIIEETFYSDVIVLQYSVLALVKKVDAFALVAVKN